MKRMMAALAVAALLATPAWAAKDSREKQMLRRMQQQMQQSEQARLLAEQEKTAALADKDGLQKQLAQAESAARAARQQARADKARLDQELVAVRAELAGVKTRLENAEKQLVDSQQQQRTTAQTLAATEHEKKQTEASLSDRDRNLQTCRSHNAKLYETGRELMQKYRDKSCQDAVLQHEPFTGLKQVEVENLLETWRDALERDRLGKPESNH